MSKTVAGFDKASALSLVRSIDKRAKHRTVSGTSSYHHYFSANDGLTIAVVPTEPRDALQSELALAHGLRHARDNPLTLMVPQGTSKSSLTRLPWLRKTVSVYEYGDDGVAEMTPWTRKKVINSFAKQPISQREYDLGLRTNGVDDLTDWATSREELSPAHRESYLAWHFMGRQVLQVQRARGRRVKIAAGIQYSKRKPEQSEGLSRPFDLPLTQSDLAEIKRAVAGGISDRILALDPPDPESRFQSVLRASPELIGLTDGVRREFPVFRPGHETAGRGFIDLLGVDLQGHVQIVETKLGSDAMLVLQGLDYWIWIHAHVDAIRRDVLNVPSNAPIELHFVVDVRKGRPHLSPYSPFHLQALSLDIPWHVTGIESWETKTRSAIRLPIGEVP